MTGHTDGRRILFVDDWDVDCPNCGDDRFDFKYAEPDWDPETGQEREVIRGQCHNCIAELQTYRYESD